LLIHSVDNPCFRVYEQYKHLLLIRSDYPLSPIYSTKNLAKKISRDEVQGDKANLVGPGKDTAILGMITVKIESFGDLYRKLLEEVNEMQKDLFGGIGFDDEEWMSFKVPEALVDLVNFGDPGYCFGEEDHNDLKKYEHLGLKILLHHPRFKDRYGYMVSQDKFIPNAVACHEFLRRASLVRSKLATATHISVGGPARGTELTAHYLRNHPQGDIRNVKVVDGDLCLVAGYNKSSGAVSLFLGTPSPLVITNARFRQRNRRGYIDFSPRPSINLHSSTGSSSGPRRSSSLQYLALIQQKKISDSGSTLAFINRSLQKTYQSA